MTMAFAVKDGVPSMRFETRDSASMLFRQVDIYLVAYPMLAWVLVHRVADQEPARQAARRRSRRGS